MRSEPGTSVRSVDGRLLATIVESAFVALAEHLEQHLGARLRQRHAASSSTIRRKASIKLARYEM
jgi:hypothetical protein